MKRAYILREKALFFLDAINNEDYKNAKKCLHPQFVFIDPLNKTTGLDDFISLMKKRDLKYPLLKAFATDQDVCLVYNIIDGIKKDILAFGLYGFEDDKIKSLEIVYDSGHLLDLPKT